MSCTKKELNSSGTSKFRLAGSGNWIKSFFCLTRWETLKRLALEGSVNCVAYSSVTSSNADATETAGVETSLNSLIFLETFLAPTFPKQISWLWFPRIEISCSPLVIAEVRQLSVWYWAQFQAVVNLFSLFFVIFVAVDYQNCFRFARLHKFNATHCRVVFEFSCLVNEFEIPFHFVVSHLAFTFDFHKKHTQRKWFASLFWIASTYLIKLHLQTRKY